jgi:hypothetical protein
VKKEIWIVTMQDPTGYEFPHSAYISGEAAMKARDRLGGYRIFEAFLHGPLDIRIGEEYVGDTSNTES